MIDAGQIVCIVEAMKMMNEIKSEFRGKIVQLRLKMVNQFNFLKI
ncbi:MAG: hypothetical protein Ct9H90mP6_11820 [Gammaproteobacteria bacterium]|nr:MAG: hypothetical protein Ct9H90mP6_11820 [Gammaproteobacteria bacterium]